MRLPRLRLPFRWRASDAPGDEEKAFHAVNHRTSFWGLIQEAFPGAWQQNVEIKTEDILRHPAVQAALALISGDVAKLRLRLMKRGDDAIWGEIRGANPVFRKPNHYQTRVQFFEQWLLSLLIYGNTYVLKHRDIEGKVIALYVLDPCNVTPLVSDDGQIFYQLRRDNLSALYGDTIVAPASEIIHDRYKPKYHPLVGCAPVEACALAAAQGMAIQKNATAFFRNGSRPGGILTSPGPIKPQDVAGIKQSWETNFSGTNAGKVAVLTDGLKYEPMHITAADAKLIEQLKMTSEMVAMAFNLPLHKISAGPPPAYGNVQSGEVVYYSQCLQTLIENIEALLDDGLDMGENLACEFDVDDLLRMDTAAQMEALDKGKNLLKPDEARRRLNLPPVDGGDAVYRQQQDYSLAALAKRDAKDDPFAKDAQGGSSPGEEGKVIDMWAVRQRATGGLNARFRRTG